MTISLMPSTGQAASPVQVSTPVASQLPSGATMSISVGSPLSYPDQEGEEGKSDTASSDKPLAPYELDLEPHKGSDKAGASTKTKRSVQNKGAEILQELDSLITGLANGLSSSQQQVPSGGQVYYYPQQQPNPYAGSAYGGYPGQQVQPAYQQPAPGGRPSYPPQQQAGYGQQPSPYNQQQTGYQQQGGYQQPPPATGSQYGGRPVQGGRQPAYGAPAGSYAGTGGSGYAPAPYPYHGQKGGDSVGDTVDFEDTEITRKAPAEPAVDAAVARSANQNQPMPIGDPIVGPGGASTAPISSGNPVVEEEGEGGDDGESEACDE